MRLRIANSITNSRLWHFVCQARLFATTVGSFVEGLGPLGRPLFKTCSGSANATTHLNLYYQIRIMAGGHSPKQQNTTCIRTSHGSDRIAQHSGTVLIYTPIKVRRHIVKILCQPCQTGVVSALGAEPPHQREGDRMRGCVGAIGALVYARIRLSRMYSMCQKPAPKECPGPITIA